MSTSIKVHRAQWDIVKFSQNSLGVGSLKTRSCMRTHCLSLLEARLQQDVPFLIVATDEIQVSKLR